MIDALGQLVRGGSLDEEQAEAAMTAVMSGEATSVQVAGLLVALRMKGESADEIAGLVRAARAHATPFPLRDDLRDRVVDTCGTGGDSLGTFNISTLAAIVAAAGGALIAKHGNRAASSRCGSADVLEALGVKIDLSPAHAARCLEQVGIAFLFAPVYHPAFRHAAVPRRELGIRTVFNVLGPLCNPAGARRQTLGVADGTMAGRMAAVLQRMPTIHAMIVHSDDGMDELSTACASTVIEIREGILTESTIDPDQLGLAPASAADLKGGDAQLNAEIAHSILGGESGPRRDVVVLNAAAALLVGGLVRDFPEGIHRAAITIDSGAATELLARWSRFTQAVVE